MTSDEEECRTWRLAEEQERNPQRTLNNRLRLLIKKWRSERALVSKYDDYRWEETHYLKLCADQLEKELNNE